MGKWMTLLNKIAEEKEYIKINPPATESQIKEVEEKLGIVMPNDLRELLQEVNGDQWFLFDTDNIIQTNLMLRKNMTSFMSLDNIVFIAGNGCGDYYGYPITEDGIKDWEIFIWEHETDNRVFKANGLKDAIIKYYNDEI